MIIVLDEMKFVLRALLLNAKDRKSKVIFEVNK
jgi:hypothetical protein